jgi:hypothetical protein
MRVTTKSGVFAAAVLAVTLPSLGFAESLREPSDFGEESDGAEISVQLDEEASDAGGDDYVGDEDSTDASDESTDVSEDSDLSVVDEDDVDDVAEVVDAWVTTTDGGDEPIYLEFASGSGPVQRDALPHPTVPDTGPSSSNLVAADRFDATLGINVHDKVAVAAQCVILQESGETYQAFYKLYCD